MPRFSPSCLNMSTSLGFPHELATDVSPPPLGLKPGDDGLMLVVLVMVVVTITAGLCEGGGIGLPIPFCATEGTTVTAAVVLPPCGGLRS